MRFEYNHPLFVFSFILLSDYFHFAIALQKVFGFQFVIDPRIYTVFYLFIGKIGYILYEH